MRHCICQNCQYVQEVIKMPVLHYDGVSQVNTAFGEMKQSIIDARWVWLNVRTKCYVQQVHAREVRIDQQGASSEFELVTVRAEISHAHALVRTRAGIANNQMRVRSESGSE